MAISHQKNALIYLLYIKILTLMPVQFQLYMLCMLIYVSFIFPFHWGPPSLIFSSRYVDLVLLLM